MADWGIHYINNIRIVLGLDLPSSVSAIGGTTRNFSSDNPDHLDVRFDFAGLPVYWSHKAWGYQSPSPERNIGVYYYGDKATIFADDMGWQIFYADGTKKNSKDAGFDPGSAFNLPFEKMFNEFAEGIRKKSNAGITNTFEKAQKTTCCVIYADMAFRTKSELIIDPATLEIKNNKQAQALLKREYRAPYVHPYKG
jgi:predicted dehydrogenase